MFLTDCDITDLSTWLKLNNTGYSMSQKDDESQCFCNLDLLLISIFLLFRAAQSFVL